VTSSVDDWQRIVEDVSGPIRYVAERWQRPPGGTGVAHRA
jgi:hypothetical protein